MWSGREVVLHALIYGSTYIWENDLFCPKCKRTTIFDGRDDALFAVSRRTMFAPELLDQWLYSVAMLEQTFREAFDVTLKLSRSTSVEFARWGGFPLSCKVHLGNQAFAKFLRCIEYRDELCLHSLFSCKTCERVDERGRRVLRAVMLDGTATGVLGKLSILNRPKTLIPLGASTAKVQFLIPHQLARGFFYQLFSKMGSAQSKRYFTVNVPSPTVCEPVSEILLNEAGNPRHIGHGLELAMMFLNVFKAPSLQLALSKKIPFRKKIF